MRSRDTRPAYPCRIMASSMLSFTRRHLEGSPGAIWYTRGLSWGNVRTRADNTVLPCSAHTVVSVTMTNLRAPGTRRDTRSCQYQASAQRVTAEEKYHKPATGVQSEGFELRKENTFKELRRIHRGEAMRQATVSYPTTKRTSPILVSRSVPMTMS